MRGLGRIFKRGSVYWIAYYHRGEEYRESSESESESQARKLLQEAAKVKCILACSFPTRIG